MNGIENLQESGLIMNLAHVRIFLAVAEEEHVTRAAEALFMTQPAVTKTIHRLEQELGLPLIEHRGRSIVLTEAGRIVRDYGRRIFMQERELVEVLDALRDAEADEILLGASTTTGVYLLPLAVARFREQHPGVQLQIAISNSATVVEQILNWQQDGGLVEGKVSLLPTNLHVEIVARDHLILVVAPTHRWSQVSEVHPEETLQKELVLRERGSGSREVINQAYRVPGLQISPLLTLPENEVIKQLVASGVGATLLPPITVQRELQAGTLVRVPLVGLDLSRQMSLMRRKERRLSRASQAFYSLTRTVLEEEIDHSRFSIERA